MTEDLIKAQIDALQKNTAALHEHSAALHEQAEAQKKLERTLHLIFEDAHGYVNGAADAKLRKLERIADAMVEASKKAMAAAEIAANGSNRRY